MLHLAEIVFMNITGRYMLDCIQEAVELCIPTGHF